MSLIHCLLLHFSSYSFLYSTLVTGPTDLSIIYTEVHQCYPQSKTIEERMAEKVRGLCIFVANK